jgi:class 3 adenylate cyclase
LRGLLEEHLGKRITDEILDGKISTKLGGERRRMGILMADIRNFTGYSEHEDPSHVVAFLNRFFKAMTAMLKEFRGPFSLADPRAMKLSSESPMERR